MCLLVCFYPWPNCVLLLYTWHCQLCCALFYVAVCLLYGPCCSMLAVLCAVVFADPYSLMLAVLCAAVCAHCSMLLSAGHAICCCVCGGSCCFSAGRAVLLCACWPMLLSAGRAVCCFVLIGPSVLLCAYWPISAALCLLAHQCCFVLIGPSVLLSAGVLCACWPMLLSAGHDICC